MIKPGMIWLHNSKADTHSPSINSIHEPCIRNQEDIQMKLAPYNQINDDSWNFPFSILQCSKCEKKKKARWITEFETEKD